MSVFKNVFFFKFNLSFFFFRICNAVYSAYFDVYKYTLKRLKVKLLGLQPPKCTNDLHICLYVISFSYYY